MRRSPILQACVFPALLLFAQPGHAQELSPEARAVAELGPVPKGRLSDAAVPTAYRLDLSIDPSQDSYSGKAQIDVTLAAPTNYIDMHGLDLKMEEATATVGGKTYQGYWAQLDGLGAARLAFRQQLPAGPVTLDFTYSHAFNDGPVGLFRVKVGDQWFAWSQLQSIDARQVFPSFDEPGFKVPFTITLRTPKGMTAVTNTLETASIDMDKTTAHFFAPTKPIPTYLVAFMVGPFAQAPGTIPASRQRSEPIPQRIVTTPDNVGQTGFALDATAKMIPLMEDYFGLTYPYAKLDQITSPILPGAMENAAAILYEDNLLILDDQASTSQKRGAGMVMAHELSHQWFGDLVTPVWWDDIWLNEAFANWAGYTFADRWRPDLHVWEGALGEGFEAMNLDALVVGRPIQQQIDSNGQIDAAFDAITYGKGGHVIAMIAGFMGQDKFRTGVRRHLAAHAYGSATSADFFSALADAAGDPRIVAAMKGFVQQQGVPLVTVAGANGRYTVSQSRYARLGAMPPPTQWSVPLCMSRGAARKCALLGDASAPFSLPGTGPLLPNAGGTGYYRFELPAAEWDALIGRASTLKGGEAQAVADSLRASFLAGRATPAQLISLTRKLAANPDSYAFDEAGTVLGLLDMGNALGTEGEAAFRTLTGRIYAPILEKLGFDPARGAYAGADPAQTELRNRLVRQLAFYAWDEGVRRTLLQAATAYFEGDENALDPAFAATALDVYVAEGDLARVQDLAERALASQDLQFRPAAIRALAKRNDMETAAWLLDELGLNDDRLRSTELVELAVGVAAQDSTRVYGIDWFDAHYAGLARDIGTFNLSLRIPRILEGFCSAQDAAMLQARFEDRVKGTPAELPFVRGLEEVRNCGALIAVRGAEMREAVIAAR